jgi:hypothetical protein
MMREFLIALFETALLDAAIWLLAFWWSPQVAAERLRRFASGAASMSPPPNVRRGIAR